MDVMTFQWAKHRRLAGKVRRCRSSNIEMISIILLSRCASWKTERFLARTPEKCTHGAEVPDILEQALLLIGLFTYR